MSYLKQIVTLMRQTYTLNTSSSIVNSKRTRGRKIIWKMTAAFLKPLVIWTTFQGYTSESPNLHAMLNEVTLQKHMSMLLKKSTGSRRAPHSMPKHKSNMWQTCRLPSLITSDQVVSPTSRQLDLRDRGLNQCTVISQDSQTYLALTGPPCTIELAR
jgi:hypothetical protein